MPLHFRCFVCLWISALGNDEEDMFAALGQELEHEDCSLLGGSRQCDAATAFLQTKSAYRWSEAVLGAETDKTVSPPSFFQMGEEVTSQVGVVHDAATAVAGVAGAVGEVHVDRSKQMRQWQEDAVEIYAETHTVQSATAAKSAVTVVTATLSESRGALAKMQTFLSASGLWLALFTFVLLAAAFVATCWWSPKAKTEEKEEVEEKVPADPAAAPLPQFIPQPAAERPAAESPQSRAVPSELRRQIQETRIISEELHLELLLPAASGYDCALARPASSQGAVRMLARIEGPLPGGPPPLGLLRAPLSQRSCVFFSAAVEEAGKLLHKVVDSVDFQVSLVDAPSIRIDVTGSDLLMLDALDDNWTPTQSLGSLPRPWREFLELSVANASSTGSFRFREDVLLVGSQVLLCGELLRDTRGRMFLQPADLALTKVGTESWRTSWECESSRLGPSVLASNDITLAEELPAESTVATAPFPSFDTADFPQPFLML